MKNDTLSRKGRSLGKVDLENERFFCVQFARPVTENY